MKLIKQTSINFISASVIFFLISSLCLYVLIRQVENYYIEAQIQEKKEWINHYIEQHDDLPYLYQANIKKKVDTLDYHWSENKKDSIIYNPIKQTYELYRVYSYSLNKGSDYFSIELYESKSFLDRYLLVFAFILVLSAVLLFLILFFVNRHAVKKTLGVFYTTINQLEHFKTRDFTSKHLVLDENTEIDEFKKLNNAINKMSERIHQDFINLKQYSENTSHELQTPLAILMIQLEELIQSENLTKAQILSISELISTVDRLSNINKALILMAKIDNRMFDKKDNILLYDSLLHHIELYKAPIEEKQISLEINVPKERHVVANKMLIDTLLNNLISNAVKHNVSGGSIVVSYRDSSLCIENTGLPSKEAPDIFFQRFRKGNRNSSSLGIGLSIVKRISDVSQYNIQYRTKDDKHCIYIDL